MIMLQPYKSRKLNTYHTILPFIISLSCLSCTTLDQAEVKARWMIGTAAIFTGMMAIFPTLVAGVYVVYCIIYRCYKKYQPDLEIISQKNNNKLRLVTEEKHEEKSLCSTPHKQYHAIDT